MKIRTTKIRKRIKELICQIDFDGIGSLDGFTIYERRDAREDRRIGFGCVRFVFSGIEENVQRWVNNATNPPWYEEVQEPKEGDLVTYFFLSKIQDHNSQPIATHTGLYLGNHRVRSKFRESHVYEHPLEDIPENYGLEVRFFREL